jgi:voltage-gated potassium channel
LVLTPTLFLLAPVAALVLQPKWAENGTVITYHTSIYWAAVTLTTVGYGDFSPSWSLTQMLVIVYLCMTFTVLPFLTGEAEAVCGTFPQYGQAPGCMLQVTTPGCRD